MQLINEIKRKSIKIAKTFNFFCSNKDPRPHECHRFYYEQLLWIHSNSKIVTKNSLQVECIDEPLQF